MKLYNVLLVCACLCMVQSAKKLPSYFPQCSRDDPKLNQCLMKAAETVRPYLLKGVPELSIPSIEPFGIPEVTLEQGTDALNIKAVLHNTTIHGLGNYKFSKFEFDVEKYEFRAKAIVKPISLEGDYKVNGRILVAPIEGQGQFTAAIESADVDFYQKVQRTKNKKGIEFLTPTYTNTSIRVDKPKAHLTGLFGGNEELNSVTNRIINDNVDVLFEEIRPVIEKILTDVLNNILLQAFETQIPFDDLYPPKK
ncbi:protein takeout [Aethina tumida]|uniref:protein takeout n=1 Tax=Aethina tumida TaxID=116153 RepID=UPI002147453E|nr:protein takeout [Aethina tumida]